MNYQILQKNIKNKLIYRKILFSILTILLCLFIPVLKKFILERHYFNNLGIIRLFYLTYSNLNCSILLFVAPILCSIPYATSYLYEKDQVDFDKNIKSEGFRKYFIKKILLNSIIGGAVLVEGICIFVCIMYFSHRINISDIQYVCSISQEMNNKSLFLILQLLLSFLFGMLCANISLCISIFIPNKKLSILFPFFIYIIFSLLNSKFNLQVLYSLDIGLKTSIGYRFGCILILNFIAYIVYFLGIHLLENNSINYNRCKRIYSMAIYLTISAIIIVKLLEHIYLSESFGFINGSDFLINILNDKNIMFIFLTVIFLNKIILSDNKFKSVKNIIVETAQFMLIIVFICFILDCLISYGSNTLYFLIEKLLFLIIQLKYFILTNFKLQIESILPINLFIFIFFDYILFLLVNSFYKILIDTGKGYIEEKLALFIIFLVINLLPNFINPLSLSCNIFLKYNLKVIKINTLFWICILVAIYIINYIFKNKLRGEKIK